MEAGDPVPGPLETHDEPLVNSDSGKVLQELHLAGGTLVRLDRRSGDPQEVCRLHTGQFGTNISICPGRPHLLAAPTHETILLFDTRAAARPLLNLGEGRDWAGAAWSPAGKRLLGCPVGTGNVGRQLVWWERQQLDRVFGEDGALKPFGSFELNSGREFSFSRNYGAMWSPWQEDVVITAANFSKSKNRSVLAVDVKSKTILSEESVGCMDKVFRLCIASHPTRPQLKEEYCIHSPTQS